MGDASANPAATAGHDMNLTAKQVRAKNTLVLHENLLVQVYRDFCVILLHVDDMNVRRDPSFKGNLTSKSRLFDDIRRWPANCLVFLRCETERVEMN